MNDRQRKDRLIQTRVPQNLESTLKDEARKRRLSVSHLIRNVLEDTFNLVDNVVVDFDRVVTDSVEMANTLRRDAQRLAATARGETAHREEAARREQSHKPVDVPAPEEAQEEQEDELEETSASEPPPPPPETPARMDAFDKGPLSQVYAFQELVLNRAAECARCEQVIGRGSRAYLGLTGEGEAARIWVCGDCLDALSAQD